ncbi:hypothetical protein [Methanolobus chelungpuianus]|nr:hypothetical protein [Methanolobus chelungpuianus]
MKLAIFEDVSLEDDIKKCCKKNNTLYIPLMNNLFGLLAESSNLSYGSEDSSHENETNVTEFVETYKCTLKSLEARKSFFTSRPKVVYNGKILDNRFFRNIISYCQEKKMDFYYAIIRDSTGDEDRFNEIDQVKSYFAENERAIFIRVGFCIDGETLIFSRRGYINYSGDLQSFNNKKEELLTMLKTGLENNHD